MAGPDARRVRRGADRAGRPVEHRAVGLLARDPNVGAGPRLDDVHGHLVAVVAEDLGHTDLAADEPLLARHQLIRRGPRRPRPSPPLGEAAAKPPLEGPAAGRSTRPRYESARGRESKWRASRGPREEPTGAYAVVREDRRRPRTKRGEVNRRRIRA